MMTMAILKHRRLKCCPGWTKGPLKGDTMTERICESCGKRFASEMLRDKLENGAIVVAAMLLPIYALHCLSDGEGLIGVISALMYFALAAAAFVEMRKRDTSGEAECVVFGRKCPSCGGRSADMDSPLGEQLMAYWSSSPNIGDERRPLRNA